jgi:translocation and assembly module TamB
MRRKLQTAAAVMAILFVVLLAIALFVLNGAPGQRWARERVIQRLQQMTGGRAELGSFRWRLSGLEFQADGLTIYGRQPDSAATATESQIPWLHADHLRAKLNFSSLLHRRIGLKSLVVEKPVFHIIIHPDGSSNQPRPVGADSVGELFQLSIGRLDVRDGAVIVNEHSLPLDVRADEVQAQLSSAGSEEYRGTIEAGNITARYYNLTQAGSGTLRFRVRREGAVIESATWSSADLRFEASGNLTNYLDPEAQIYYKAELQARRLAGISQMNHLRAGRVQVAGSAHYKDHRLDTRGKIAVRDADWVSGSVRVRNLTFGADYVIGPEDASFPHVFASALGGTISGAVEVKNWQSETGAALRQQGTAKLHVESISLHDAVAAASSRQLPLGKLNLRGRTSGMVTVDWSGKPESAKAHFDLAVRAPTGAEKAANQQPPQLPVAGSALGSYAFAPARLEFDHLDLVGPALQLSVAGELGTVAANAQIALQSGQLSGLVPLLSMLLPQIPPPDGITGEGSFSGSLTGTMERPSIQGRLNLLHLMVPLKSIAERDSTAGNPAALNSGALDSISLDSVTADVLLTPDQLALNDAQIQAGESAISGNLSANLLSGKLSDVSGISGRVTLRDTQIAELQKVAHVQFPMSGAASGVLQIGGSWGDPRVAGDVEVRHASLYGEPLDSVHAAVTLTAGEFALDRLSASFDRARATGRAAYNLKSKMFRLELQGSGLELARLRRIQSGRLSLSGHVQFDLNGSGTLSQPSLGGTINVESMVVNGERLGGLRVQGATRQGTLHIEAASQFNTGSLSLDGDIGLHGELPAKAELRVSAMDVDALLSQILRDNLTGHSVAAGVIQLQGPLRQPSQLSVRGNLEQLSAQLRGIELENRGPIEFGIERNVLTLGQFRLAGSGTDLTATGTAELTGRHRLRLQARGDADLALLKIFNPNLESSGATTFQVNVGGTASNPDMRGTARVHNGSIAYENLPNGLSELNGTLIFDQDRLEVQSLNGKTGGGDVAIGGFLNIGQHPTLNLTMKGQGVRLRQPPGVSSLLNLNLQLTGGSDHFNLSGNVLVTRFAITPQFDLGYYIAGLKRGIPPNPLSPLNRLQLELQVTSAPELQVETSAARLTGDVDLNVRGTAAHPVLIGSVNATEGEVVFEGARYQVNHAEITFNNPVRLEPVFDAELMTRIREYEVTLNFYGPLDRLNTTYRSEPPLPTSEIVGLLAFGQTRPESVQVTRPALSFSQSESQAILDEAMNSALNDRVQKLFGVSRLRISPADTVGTQINPSARLTLERQVSRNMTVIYVTNVSQSSQQVIQMEYNVSPSIALVATRDENGIVSFDIRIRQRRR